VYFSTFRKKCHDKGYTNNTISNRKYFLDPYLNLNFISNVERNGHIYYFLIITKYYNSILRSYLEIKYSINTRASVDVSLNDSIRISKIIEV
jgi:hypothetical protein